ncbi:MAG: hypothetical protein IT281_10120 [Ignavibacteria bacterium]|nr:hypothetical protein [Ignavibacteria bacterium]
MNTKIEQNEIEIILYYFNFDQDKINNSFKNDKAKNILSEWTLTKKEKKNLRLHSKTSTPMKYSNDCDLRKTYLNDLNLRKIDSNSITRSQKMIIYYMRKKSFFTDDDLAKNIKSHEESIKKMRKK